MIERAISSKSARTVLLEEYNDIDVYIEDTTLGFKKVFIEILNKAFRNQFKIQHVFPLGTRDVVVEECRKNQESDGRKKLFVVDGDLYLLRGERIEELNGLFVLPRYCIENFLIDEIALADVLYEEDPEITKEELISRLNFAEWINLNEDLLVNLFTDYAVVHKLFPEIQTVGYKVSDLTRDGSGVVCPQKIQARIEDLSNKVKEKVGVEIYDVEREKIYARILHENNKLLKYVSGKDYLLPLIKSRCKSFMKLCSSNTNIVIRLAIKSDIKDLENIVDFIIE